MTGAGAHPGCTNATLSHPAMPSPRRSENRFSRPGCTDSVCPLRLRRERGAKSDSPPVTLARTVLPLQARSGEAAAERSSTRESTRQTSRDKPRSDFRHVLAHDPKGAKQHTVLTFAQSWWPRPAKAVHPGPKKPRATPAKRSSPLPKGTTHPPPIRNTPSLQTHPLPGPVTLLKTRTPRHPAGGSAFLAFRSIHPRPRTPMLQGRVAGVAARERGVRPVSGGPAFGSQEVPRFPASAPVGASRWLAPGDR